MEILFNENGHMVTTRLYRRTQRFLRYCWVFVELTRACLVPLLMARIEDSGG
jgi:hypothetical protein